MKNKILLSFLCIFLLSGCYNYRELNDLAITTAIGIDKTDNGYETIIQVVNTKKQGTDASSSGDEPKFIIYKSEGKTLQEALRKVIMESPKRLYTNHLSLLIFSERLAKEGIGDLLDLFARDSELRKQFIVLISKNPDKIMSTQTLLETLNAKNIKDSIIADSKYLGSSYIVTFEELLSAYLNDKKDIVLPTVTMNGDDKDHDKDDNIKSSEPNARLVLSDLAVFNKDKLINFLGMDDSINISLLTNKIKNTIYNYECDKNKYASIEITNAKTNIKNNKIDVNIDIKEKGTINEINCDINLRKNNEIKKLEEKIEKDMKKNIENTIKKLVEMNCDVIGFKDILYKNNPKYYKEIVNKYQKDLLKKLNFKINIDLDLYAKGNMLKET